MYRVSLYLSRFLRALSRALYVAYDTAEDQQAQALTQAKNKRAKAASLRLEGARSAAESAKARLTVETDNFKAEIKAAKEMY